MTDKELIESMAHKNGRMKIICKLKEELGELSLAFARLEYAECEDSNVSLIIENIHEEFVDVEVMMIQFKTLLKQEMYTLKREEKLERIKNLLDADV